MNRITTTSLAFALTLTPIPTYADSVRGCWAPIDLFISAPDSESYDSIRELLPEQTDKLLTAVDAHGKKFSAKIDRIFISRWSAHKETILTFAFDEHHCLVDRGSMSESEWNSIFGDEKEGL